MYDQEILQLIRSRQERGLSLLREHYAPLILYILAPILTDERDREECLSDILLRVWNGIGRYQEEKGSFAGWLTAIARNTAIDLARKNARQTGESVLEEESADPAPTPEEALLIRERKKQVTDAVEKLPEREKLIVYRRYFYRQPMKQIAAEMGLSLRAAEGLLYRARKRLQKKLGGIWG